jgi:hypothetical protein
MAKKKRAKLKVTSPSQPVMEGEKDWQKREDADRIKRYAELTREPERHRAAMDHINAEHDSIRSLLGSSEPTGEEGRVMPRAVARSGRKKSIRVPRKGSRR